MADERRSTRRARISGVRVTYESATGDRVDADAHDIGCGGLFVRAAKPLPIGKRLALEIQVVGEREAWSALGRVIWTREAGDTNQPPGMGVKLIDIEDSAVAAIGRLVESRQRERTEPGVGEPTGNSLSPPAAREASIPIPLVTRTSEVASAAHESAATVAAPARADKRGGCGWLVVLSVCAAAAGIAGYLLFDGVFRPLAHESVPPAPPAAKPPVQAFSVAAPAAETGGPSLSAPPANVSPPASASTTGSSQSPKKTTPPSSTATGRTPAPGAKRTDNPY